MPQTSRTRLKLLVLVILEALVIVGLLASIYYQHRIIKDIVTSVSESATIEQLPANESDAKAEAAMQEQLKTTAEEQDNQPGLDAEVLELKLKSLNGDQ